ncbi:MAG: CPBP family intramembrane glutamic endopeptidase [Chloroflexota bacterium]
MQNIIHRIYETEDAPPWGIFNALLALILMFVFISFGGLSIGTIMFPNDDVTALIAAWVIGSALTVGYVLATRRSAEEFAALRLGPSTLPVLIAFGIGLGVAVTLDLVAIPFAGSVLRPPETAFFPVEGVGLSTWIYAGLLLLVVQPMADELVFRGVLFPAMRTAQGVWATILATALFYGVFHSIVYPHPEPGAAGVWYRLFEPFFAGLALSFIRAVSGSTRATIAAHVGIGTFGFLKTLLILGGAG